MRIVASAVVASCLLVARDARADRHDCNVVFVRAPDNVRIVIQSWLEAEPRCNGSIELRVIETGTGSLYLIAQRPDGRIHEREVPDAQSAGVLVASWVADDWTSPPPAEAPAAPPAPPLTPPSIAPVTASPFATPGVAATLPTPVAPRGTGRWFSAAAMIQTEGEGGQGVRFEIDLLGGATTGWTIGLAAVGVSSQMDVSTPQGYGTLDTLDVRGLVVASRAWRLGQNWHLRWSGGLGPAYTEGVANLVDYTSTPETMTYLRADGVNMAYETSVVLAREVMNHRWAITAGPAATLLQQQLTGADPRADMVRAKVELMFALGARYRL